MAQPIPPMPGSDLVELERVITPGSASNIPISSGGGGCDAGARRARAAETFKRELPSGWRPGLDLSVSSFYDPGSIRFFFLLEELQGGDHRRRRPGDPEPRRRAPAHALQGCCGTIRRRAKVGGVSGVSRSNDYSRMGNDASSANWHRRGGRQALERGSSACLFDIIAAKFRPARAKIGGRDQEIRRAQRDEVRGGV